MKRFWRIVLIVILSSSAALANHQSRQLILEAHLTTAENTPLVAAELYIRIYDDGRVEWGDLSGSGDVSEELLSKRKVSAAKINAFVEFLNNSSVSHLAENYPDIKKSHKYSTFLNIKISHRNQTQTISIENFSPASPEAGNIYPASLIELICRIEQLRKNPTFRIADNPKRWCLNQS